jgi:hypothetical protein
MGAAIKKTCVRNHSLDDAYVYVNAAGKTFRYCRACKRLRAHAGTVALRLLRESA